MIIFAVFNVISYIYKVNDMDLKIDDFEAIPEVNIKNYDCNSIEGKFLDIDVEFIYRINSKFLFLNTEKRSLKRKAFKLFYKAFDGNISLFSPSFKKERNMICNANYKNLKFIHDNELVFSDKLNESYCNGTIKEDYYLFEAELHFSTNQKECRFRYYRNSIEIKKSREGLLFEIIAIFEKYMCDNNSEIILPHSLNGMANMFNKISC